MSDSATTPVVLNFPTSIPTCTLTKFGWTGGVDYFPALLTFYPGANFPIINIETNSTSGLDLTLNYPLGTFVGWNFAKIGATTLPDDFHVGNFTIDQSGPTNCYDIIEDNVNTHVGGSDDSNSTSTMAWDFGVESTTIPPTFSGPSCSPLNLLWVGGTPNFTINLDLLASSTSGTASSSFQGSLSFTSVTQRNFTVNLPFPAGSTYNVTLYGSGAPDDSGTLTSGPQVVPEGGTSGCLISAADTASASTSGVSKGSIICGVVAGVLGLCLIAGAFLLYRRRSRRARAAKRKKLENIVSGGAYTFPETPRDSEPNHIPLSPLSDGKSPGGRP